jgi:hypothetical protein
MTIQYTWSIKALDCLPESEGKSNVIFTVHWVLSGTDGKYSSSTYGTQTLSYDAKNAFTPYANLTESEIIGWVQNAMDNIDEVKAILDAQIANQAKPKVIQPLLPWATEAVIDETLV